MPTRASFPSAQQQGTVGEEFIMAHLEALISSDLLLNLQNTSSAHVAGMDSTSQIIHLGEPVESTGPAFLIDGVPCVSRGRRITSWVLGANEFKTIHNFLTRTDDNELPCGTLGFELWEDTERQHPGWLIHFLDPVKRNQAVDAGQARTKAVQPAILVYLLCSGDNVFAAVVFENVSELLDFLWAKAAQAGADLDSLPTGEAAQSFQPAGLMIRDNMWLIPLKEIAHLATVTMIGDKPFIRPTIEDHEKRCSNSTQNQRYEYLCSLAGNRHMPYDETYRHAFIPKPSEQVFADAIYNLSVLNTLDEAVYPTLAALKRRTSVIRHLEGLLLNMLAHAYPIWPKNHEHYFPIGKEALEAWCKDNGIPGSSVSWQGHLIFLEDCGLTKSFRPIGQSDDPILQTAIDYATENGYPNAVTFRTVPRYSKEVLAHAEEIAAIYTSCHANLSHLAKADVIRIRGVEIADALYHDRRIISMQERRAHDAWLEVVNETIDEHDFAVKDQVIRAVRQRLPRNKPYRDAIRKLKDRTRNLANEANCEYRPIRKNDRERWDIPERYTGWIIAKKQDE